MSRARAVVVLHPRMPLTWDSASSWGRAAGMARSGGCSVHASGGPAAQHAGGRAVGGQRAGSRRAADGQQAGSTHRLQGCCSCMQALLGAATAPARTCTRRRLCLSKMVYSRRL